MPWRDGISERQATHGHHSKHHEGNLLSVDRHAFGELFAYHPPLRRMFDALIDERRHASMRPEPEGQPDLTIVTRQQTRLDTSALEKAEQASPSALTR
jgi:hypothetical protein